MTTPLQLSKRDRWPALAAKFTLKDYVLVTHRPSNVDRPDTLAEIMAALQEISRQVTVLFPVHRTRQRDQGV
jgi:UDP-N-acetylglucosamine 2-epimerase (non-hydrolysing)